MSEPTIQASIEFRREQYGWNMTEMAEALDLSLPHYSEFVHGKRGLPYKAMRRAFDLGVPAKVLFSGYYSKPKRTKRLSDLKEEDGI